MRDMGRPFGTGAGTGVTASLALALALLLASAAATLRSGAQDDLPPATGSREGPPPAADPTDVTDAAAATAAVAFDHRVHVTDNALDCQLCHAYARRGPVAGLPPVARCAGCHRFVAAENPAVESLMARFEAGEPLAWTRVHRLPDYVRFTHKRHVRAGVACRTCHGDVGAMRTVEQVAPLTMGWCLGCHEQRRAPDDCLTCHY